MKKIFFSVMAAMVSMASMAALADYDGTYVTSGATIYVPADAESGDAYPLSISLKAQSSDRVLLSIKNFTYGEGDDALVIGDIDVVLAASEADGVVTLSNVNLEGETGPNAETAGVPISTKIFVQGVSQIVKDEQNILLLDLKIDGTIIETGDPMADVARVEVTDAVFTPATSVKENTVLSVYPTVATSVINVPENGEFTIYSLAGSSVKSGVVSNGTVSVADLAAGNYVISVNGKNARFIKK
ncbi:MAG: T9SS type A sorting domain-containing protein [Paludibacteraceae bacterium]|nr:T9SS type A sorting domain-containing protein [Paludibacteraceae bacterium]